jgi:hypothetical protein
VYKRDEADRSYRRGYVIKGQLVRDLLLMTTDAAENHPRGSSTKVWSAKVDETAEREGVNIIGFYPCLFMYSLKSVHFEKALVFRWML